MDTEIQDLKNIPVFYLNYNAVPYYKDKYTWQELHCLYRPLALAYNCICDGYFDLFLLVLSYYHTYMIDDIFKSEIFNKRHPVFAFANDILAKAFGVEIVRDEFSDLESMNLLMANRLKQGNIILFPEDIYDIYYSPAYKEMHDAHYVIVKGYNIEKEVYYILDNLHIKEGKSIEFVDFTIKFNDLYTTCKTFRDTYDKKSEKMYFWTLKKCNGSIKEIFNVYRLALTNRLYDRVRYSYIETEFLQESQNGISSVKYNEYLRTVNFRTVYFQSLMNIVDKYIVNKKELINKLLDAKTKWECAKLRILYSNQNQSGKQNRVNTTISNAILVDEELLELVVKCLDDINFDSDEDRKQNVINNKKVEYYIMDKSIKVKHVYDTICDTWLLHDDAWQFYINNLEKESGKLEMKISCDGKEKNSFQAGIIVIAGNKKYLFGNARNSEIAIYCPEERGNTTILEVPLENKEHCFVCIEYCGNILNFYSKSYEKESYKHLKTICASEHIEALGLFSKTWEATDNTTIFDNILYNDNLLNFNI